MNPSMSIISCDRIYSFWSAATRSYSSRVIVPESWRSGLSLTTKVESLDRESTLLCVLVLSYRVIRVLDISVVSSRSRSAEGFRMIFLGSTGNRSGWVCALLINSSSDPSGTAIVLCSLCRRTDDNRLEERQQTAPTCCEAC